MLSVNMGSWRSTIGTHGNHTLVAWQLNPYLRKNGSHSWTHCLTTVTMVSNVIMGTKVRCLQCLNNASDTAFLYNTIKIVELIRYKPTSFILWYYDKLMLCDIKKETRPNNYKWWIWRNTKSRWRGGADNMFSEYNESMGGIQTGTSRMRFRHVTAKVTRPG
jgi:hypothetical protein